MLKDRMEVSISSHEISNSSLKKKMHNDKVVHLRDSLSVSERRLNGHLKEDGPDLVPTPSVSSEIKGSEIPEENNAQPENQTDAAIQEARQEVNTSTNTLDFVDKVREEGL
ncbi:MAG: hypothetical protein ACI3ZN_10325 [Candidatus Cryptobacteroides sp.]